MKRSDLIRDIRKAAQAAGVSWEFIRAGAEHEVWRIGNRNIPIPRHGEIGPKVEFEIRKQCEAALGPRWWRK